VSTDAKASSAGSIERSNGKRRLGGLLAILALALCALGSGASAASAAPPTVTIDPVSTVGYTTATVTGTVDFDAETVANGGFWEVESSSDGGTSWSGFGYLHQQSEAGLKNVSVELAGLQPQTEYAVRISTLSIQDGSQVYSAEPNPTFTTLGPITSPLVDIQSASSVTGTTAHFSGHVTPGSTDPGFDSTCAFEYITEADYQGRDEQQQLTIKASGGSFKLTYEGEETAPLPANASAAEVDSALEALTKIGSGNVVVSGGPGDLGGTAPYNLLFPGANPSQVGIDGSGLTGAGSAKTATTTQGTFGHDEVQKLSVIAVSGTYTLSLEGQTTTPIAFDADAATVQSALQGLSTIGVGNIAVTGSPESFALTFGGALGGANLPLIAVDPTNLVGATGSAEATTTQGGHVQGFEEAQTIDCEPKVVKGTGAFEVTADVAGLEPATVYHLRLIADNQGGDPVVEESDNFETEQDAPTIVDTSVNGVTSSSAALNAQIKPGSASTTYHFEYLTLAEYEANGNDFSGATSTTEATLPGDVDNQGHLAAAAITSLSPDTVYRFRVVATNSKSAPGGTPGPARSFRTLAGPAAGDTCSNAAVRTQQSSQYLPECRAYEIVSNPGLDLGDVNRVPYASDDGDYVSYLSVGADNGALGAGVASNTVAHRTPGGWVRTSADGKATGVVAYGTGFTGPKVFSPDFSRFLVIATLPFNLRDLDGTDDLYRFDVGSRSAMWMSQDDQFSPGVIGGASQNLERVVYTGLVNGISGIQVSDGTSTELVSRYPNDEPTVVSAFAAGMFQRSPNGVGGFTGGPTGSYVERGGAHGVSDDARRVYFTAPEGLFVRDLAASPPRTAAVGVSSRTGDVGTQDYEAQFVSATHDGASAYFYSRKQLTDAATPGGGIYRFDLGTETVTQVTPDASPDGIALKGSIVSDDQSHVYFTSTAALAGSAQEGDINAYVWTSGGGFRFIGKVDATSPFLRVTPDGNYLLFTSTTSIGGAPNNGHQALYRYDYANDEVICVSCRPDGSPSDGDANVDSQSHGEPGANLMRNRALSFDGRVLFSSTDRIIGRDQTSAQDVYLYHDGTVSLLSSGREDTNSYAAEISDDGRHAFFLSRAALVGADRDVAEYDLYDAYVGGGFLEPPPPPAPCEGEACRGGASSAPGGGGPVTPGLVGPGNPKPCAKGKTRRNGRCVKPRKHKGKKHQSKGHKHKRNANANGRSGR
jgi:hypothetical protein